MKNVTITIDKKYAQSYGGKITETYPYADLNGKWIILYDKFGNSTKKDTTAKHFHDYSKEKLITQSQFEKEIAKAKKDLETINKKRKKEEEKLAKEQEIKIQKAVKIAKENLALIESKKSSYNKKSTKWCNEVAFKASGQLGLKPAVLRSALKRIYQF